MTSSTKTVLPSARHTVALSDTRAELDALVHRLRIALLELRLLVAELVLHLVDLQDQRVDGFRQRLLRCAVRPRLDAQPE